MGIIFALLVVLVMVDWWFHGCHLGVVFSIKSAANSRVWWTEFVMVGGGNGADFSVEIVEEDVEGSYGGRKKGRRREGECKGCFSASIHRISVAAVEKENG